MKAIRKFAEFVGYTLYHGERFNEWRCPNKKCGFHVSENYTCCPCCGQKIKFREPPKVKMIKLSMEIKSFRKTIENMPSVLMRDSVTYKNAVRFKLVHPDPHPVIFYFEVMDKDSVTKDIETEELEQAIEYFKNELSSINVFSDLISFKEEEEKSIETALKVLKKVREEMAAGDVCDVAQEST